jgi:excisionase family DNA binding protein
MEVVRMTRELELDDAVELVRDGALRIAEACRFAGVGRSLLYEEMAAGRLPFLKIGNARRIPRRALEEWLARHLVISGQREGA